MRMSNFEKKFRSVVAAALLSVPGGTSEKGLPAEIREPEQEIMSMRSTSKKPEKTPELKKAQSHTRLEQVKKEGIQLEDPRWNNVIEEARTTMDEALHLFLVESSHDSGSLKQISRVLEEFRVRKLSDVLEKKAIIEYVQKNRSEEYSGETPDGIRFTGNDSEYRRSSQDMAKSKTERYKLEMPFGYVKLELKDAFEEQYFEGNVFSFTVVIFRNKDLPDIQCSVSVGSYENGYSGYAQIDSRRTPLEEDPKKMNRNIKISYTHSSFGRGWFTYDELEEEVIKDREGDFISGYIRMSGENPLERRPEARYFSGEARYEADAKGKKNGSIEITDFTRHGVSFPKITLEQNLSETDLPYEYRFLLYIDSNTEPLAEVLCSKTGGACHYVGYGENEDGANTPDQEMTPYYTKKPIDFENKSLKNMPDGDELFRLIEKTVLVRQR